MVTTQLLTNQEAADFLGVSPGTLSQWRFKNKGPAYVKLSGRRAIRYKIEDLMDYVSRSRIVPGEAAGNNPPPTPPI